jgi:predicted nuclease of predicted toxin-antitoxin system
VKLLFDENLSHRLLTRLAANFSGSEHVEQAGLRGRADIEIWEYARVHGLAVVSKDNDFRQLSVLKGSPPKVVWLSVGNAGTEAIAEFLQHNSDRIATFGRSDDENLLVLELTSTDSI